MNIKAIKKQLNEYMDEMKSIENKYLGFPNNMDYCYKFISKSSSIYLNNAGDPFAALSWKKHSKIFEREVIEFFLNLYGLNLKNGWGYVTSGGTEGNMEGLYLAREHFPEAICYYSQDAHYSIEKITRLLRMKTAVVKSHPNGEMDCDDFKRLIRLNKKKQAIILANCGTTVKGAFDNLEKIKEILVEFKITKHYIHVDAALSGMILPFIKNAPSYAFDKGVNSIAISAHKFLGVPLMSGVVIVKKEYVDKIKNKIEYINSIDTTISGSRNGHSPLYIWYMLKRQGFKKFKKDAKKCLEHAEYLYNKLKENNIQAELNKFSNTVFFPKPDADVIREWQLSCYGEIVHVVVMQHVTKDKIDKLVEDIVKSNAKNQAKQFYPNFQFASLLENDRLAD